MSEEEKVTVSEEKTENLDVLIKLLSIKKSVSHRKIKALCYLIESLVDSDFKAIEKTLRSQRKMNLKNAIYFHYLLESDKFAEIEKDYKGKINTRILEVAKSLD